MTEVPEPDTRPPWARIEASEVLDLIPTLGVVVTPDEPGVEDPQALDPWSQATAEKRISERMVAHYVELVASRVSSRLSRWGAIPETSPFRQSVVVSARDSVLNGAASYAYAAAAPEKAGMSDTTDYSEVLWRRHLDSLELARQALDEWVDDGDDAGPGNRAGKLRGNFPPAKFPDGMRW